MMVVFVGVLFGKVNYCHCLLPVLVDPRLSLLIVLGLQRRLPIHPRCLYSFGACYVAYVLNVLLPYLVPHWLRPTPTTNHKRIHDIIMPHAGPFRATPHYAPPPAHPLKSTVSYDYISATDEVCIKRWLSNRLCDPPNAMSHMPGGFPFHYFVDGRGRGTLSYEPYEFCEEIPSNVLSIGGPHRRYWVTFSFTNHSDCEKTARVHSSSSHKRKGYMSWRAYVTVRDISYYRSDLRTSSGFRVSLSNKFKP
jgi:hypothetical protein